MTSKVREPQSSLVSRSITYRNDFLLVILHLARYHSSSTANFTSKNRRLIQFNALTEQTSKGIVAVECVQDTLGAPVFTLIARFGPVEPLKRVVRRATARYVRKLTCMDKGLGNSLPSHVATMVGQVIRGPGTQCVQKLISHVDRVGIFVVLVPSFLCA